MGVVLPVRVIPNHDGINGIGEKVLAVFMAPAPYRQTVLGAFAQVADVLRALEYDANTLEARTRALKSAEEALRLTEANYRAGIVSYLDLLKADRQYQQARIGYLQAEAQRFKDKSTLFIALGGGWWNDPE